MQTAIDSATIAATSYALGVAGADGAASAGEDTSLVAVPGTEVESNAPMLSLIADGASSLARIGSAAEIRRRNRDRADGPEIRHDLELVAHLLERATRRRGHRCFDNHDARRGLLMNSRLGGSIGRVEMERENVKRDLQHSADDSRTAGAAGRHHGLTVFGDDYRRHRRERTLARPPLVRKLAFEVIRVGHSGCDGE